MKIIGDIRIYKSRIENIESNSLPSYFETSKILNAKIQRIVMALRENYFSFGDFDHLYINFTTCHVDNDISFTHMSHIETGSTKLSLQVLVDIAQILEVSTDALIFEKTSKLKIQKIETILSDCNENEIAFITKIVEISKEVFEKS